MWWGLGSALGLAGAGLGWPALWNCFGALKKPIGNQRKKSEKIFSFQILFVYLYREKHKTNTTMTHVNFPTSGVALNECQLSRIREIIENSKPRSSWDRGVKCFALNLLEIYKDMRKYSKSNNEPAPDFSLDTLLNGSDSWESYCYGGMALIYDGDIARALCTPSQLSQTDYGSLAPNKMENWMDVQVRAYRNAWRTLCNVVSQVLDTYLE